jgi:hypothetical protein
MPCNVSSMAVILKFQSPIATLATTPCDAARARNSFNVLCTPQLVTGKHNAQNGFHYCTHRPVTQQCHMGFKYTYATAKN